MLKNDTLNTKQPTTLLNRISDISQTNIFTLILRFCKRTPDDDRF